MNAPFTKTTVTWVDTVTGVEASFHYFAANHDRYTVDAWTANEVRDEQVRDRTISYTLACGDGRAQVIDIKSVGVVPGDEVSITPIPPTSQGRR